MNNAIASGSYADMKLVKTRSVCQIVVEIPIEQASRFIEMFGVPVPGSEIPVAIARLNEVPDDTPEARSDKEAVKLVQKSGILCDDPEFRVWLRNMHPGHWPRPDDSVSSGEAAARALRSIFCISSRKEFATNDVAAHGFRKMVDDFYADRRLPEQRR